MDWLCEHGRCRVSRRYVILAAGGGFIPARTRNEDPEIGLLRQNLQWAEQLDASDGRSTPETGPYFDRIPDDSERTSSRDR